MVFRVESSLGLDKIFDELRRVERDVEGSERFLQGGSAQLEKFIQGFILDNGRVTPDEDFFYVTLKPNSRYRIDAEPGANGDLDLVLGLYGDPFLSPELIEDDDDDGGGLRPAIFFDTGPYRQTYLVQADTYLGQFRVDRASLEGFTDFENDPRQNRIDSFESVDLPGVTFSSTAPSGVGELEIGQAGGEVGNALFFDDFFNTFDNPELLDGIALNFSEPVGGVRLEFGNDNFFDGVEFALLEVFSGSERVGRSIVPINGNDLVDQFISVTGSNFNRAEFYFVDNDLQPGPLLEVIDNVTVSPASNSDEPIILPGGDDGESFPLPEVYDDVSYDPETDRTSIQITLNKDETPTSLEFFIPGYDPEPGDFGLAGASGGETFDPGSVARQAVGRLQSEAPPEAFFFDPPDYFFGVERLREGSVDPGADVIGNSRETALLLPATARSENALETAGDTDVFSVYLEAGESVSLALEALPGATALEFRAQGPDGGALGRAEAAGGAPAALEIDAAETGFHFAIVRDADQQAFHAPYALSVASGGETPATTGNRLPEAAPDAAETAPGEPVRIDVLANDADPEGGALSLIALEAEGLEGTATIEGGEIVYDPGAAFDDLAPGAAATETFRYAAADGAGGSAAAEVTVTLRADEAAGPLEAADDALSLVAGRTVRLDPLANDRDPGGGALSLGAVAAEGVQGELVRQGDALLYTPPATLRDLPPEGALTERFSYALEGTGGRTAEAEVVLTVFNADCVPGTAGPDAFVADGGAPCYDGRAGADEIAFPFALPADPAAIAPADGGFRVTTPSGGAVEVLSVETLVFEDATLETRESEAAASVLRYYIGGLGRLPDYAGAGFWIDRVEDGALGLDGFARAILVSEEFDARFPPGASDTEFLVDVYANVFGRDPDDDGLAFWQGRVGDAPRWQIVQIFADSDEAREIYADDTDDGVLALA